ncbi:RNA-directed DNA polymerase, eukaryota [Tanacetum coccineum]
MKDGVWLDKPEDVKYEFLSHFRDRFTHSDGIRVPIDMEFPNSISSSQQVELESDVTTAEIKRAVWDCGVDKSPGPDGFTFCFFALSSVQFWDMLEKDVVSAVKQFFTDGVFPSGCNSSFIALIPKISNANMVKDFRPISLIGSLYKIITKILANRLVPVLGDLVHDVQSAFVAGRQIMDGPFILNEVMQWCSLKKMKTLIFKVDFEKAYDSVRWDFLDEVLRKYGFGDKWRRWIQSCLSSSRGSILINGSPTSEFQFFRGLKQGDSLSPFLFILVMETLHISFQRVVDAGMFVGINLSNVVSISHMFFADDVMFIGKWCDTNISTLINVLDCFHRASGLKINMSKSKILGLQVESSKVREAAEKLGCLILRTPFTYLGTKVGDNMNRVLAWQEVIDKVKNRLSNWKMKALSIGGRLTLLKSVLGSIPLFYMSIYKTPMSVLKDLEAIRRRFFNGHDQNSNQANWVKWDTVMSAKETGGLGVASFHALNRGLMFKWLWKFFVDKDSLWTRVIKAIHGDDGKLDKEVNICSRSSWLSIVKEAKVLKNKGVDFFEYLKLVVGDGRTIRFWKDKWYHAGILKDLFPRVFALETQKDVTIYDKLEAPSLEHTFRGYVCSLEDQT